MLPDRLEYIGKRCFEESGLEEIVFPRGVRTVGLYAFIGCENLRDVRLNDGLQHLGDGEIVNGKVVEAFAFAKTGLYNIWIPPTLRYIPNYTFAQCKNLKRVVFTVRGQLEKIGFGAFKGSGLEKLKLPRSVRSICANAFISCEHLRSVLLNEGLVNLGEKVMNDGKEVEGNTFAGSGVEEIAFPSTVKEIAPGTFNECKNLRRIKFSEGLERIS